MLTTHELLHSSEMKVWNTPGFGNCFSFNTLYYAKTDPDAGQRVTSKTGSYLGMNLVLDVEQENYMLNGLTPQVK